MSAGEYEQAGAAGDDLNTASGMFQIIVRETGEVVGDIGFHGPPAEAGTDVGFREDSAADGMRNFALERP